MKKNLVFLLLPLIVACNKGFIPEENKHAEDDLKVNVVEGTLCFNSLNDFESAIEALKANNKLNVKSHFVTRTDGSEYVSLRTHLVNQGLREFTDAELAMIEAEGLVYEPEDSLIADPYMCALLNQDREVIIGETVYQYVDKGLLEYRVDQKARINDDLKIKLDTSDTSNLVHGETMRIDQDIQFTKIDYAEYVEDGISQPNNNGYNDRLIIAPPPSSQEDKEPIIEYTDKNLKLSDGTEIPKDRIRKIIYKKGNGNANWIQKTISGIFGTNVAAINEFDSKHRMKMNMFSQDYIIVRSVGMTVRMQKRVLGIWWVCKADEFRYGWTNIECEYKFNNPVFSSTPPKLGNTAPADYHPVTLIKKFPYAKDNIVLFHVANYDITTGNINKLYAASMNALAGTIRAWVNDSQNQAYAKSPRGLYATYDNDRRVLVVYPQGEEMARGTGREKVLWQHDWFSGNFVVSFGYNMSTQQFKPSVLDISQNAEVDIRRGCIYGAVKYNGQWKACVIKTE